MSRGPAFRRAELVYAVAGKERKARVLHRLVAGEDRGTVGRLQPPRVPRELPEGDPEFVLPLPRREVRYCREEHRRPASGSAHRISGRDQECMVMVGVKV